MLNWIWFFSLLIIAFVLSVFESKRQEGDLFPFSLGCSFLAFCMLYDKGLPVVFNHLVSVLPQHGEDINEITAFAVTAFLPLSAIFLVSIVPIIFTNDVKEELNEEVMSLKFSTSEKLKDICDFRHENQTQVFEFLISDYHKKNQPNI